MKSSVSVCVASVLLVLSIGASAEAVDLSTSGYNYDIAAGAGDITVIAFDYTYGDEANLPFGHAAFRIQRLNDNGTGSWLGSFNIYSTSFNLDTDYGPYSTSGSLSGIRHYEFTLNRSNGLWDLAVDGNPVTFLAISSTTTPQPDGTVVASGDVVAAKYFSDESLQSGQNAIDLGWATLVGGSLVGNAADGVGGTGAYRLNFEDALNGSVDNIQVTNVPEPASMALLGAGALALIRHKRSKA